MDRLYDLVIVLGLFAAASGCGLLVLERLGLDTSGRVQRVLFAGGLGLGLLGYVPFALGLAGVLRQSAIAAAYLAALALGLWGWWRFWRLQRVTLGELSGSLRSTTWPARLVLAFFVVAAGVNLLAALAPVIGVDELIYRVAAADLYLRHERLLYLPSIWAHQQPHQIQMIQIWGMSLGTDSTAQVVQWGMGLLLVAALVDFGRREMPLAWALLGAGIFYSFSDVVVLSGRAAPDLANGLFMVLSVLAMVRWLETGAGRWLGVAGVLAGLFAAGARLPGAYGAVGLALLVAYYGWRQFSWRPVAAVGGGLAVGLIALVVVLPWYVKSLMQAGSPTWPFVIPFFDAQDWTRPAVDYLRGIPENKIGRWYSPERIAAAPWALTMNPETFRSGVIGPLALASAPLAVFTRLSTSMRWLLLSAVVLGALWYVGFPRMRGFIPGIGLLSIAVGYLLWQVWQSETIPRWARAGLVVLAALWLVVGLGTVARTHLRAALVTLGVKDEQAYLSARLAEPDMSFEWYDDYAALNGSLPLGSRLLIQESRGYYLDFDYVLYDLLSKREARTERLQDSQYVAQQVRKLDADYVLLWPGPRYLSGFEPSNVLVDTLHELCGPSWPIVYESETMIVCEVEPGNGGDAP